MNNNAVLMINLLKKKVSTSANSNFLFCWNQSMIIFVNYTYPCKFRQVKFFTTFDLFAIGITLLSKADQSHSRMSYHILYWWISCWKTSYDHKLQGQATRSKSLQCVQLYKLTCWQSSDTSPLVWKRKVYIYYLYVYH